MSSASRIVLSAVVLAAVASGTAAAQNSMFGIRGLGVPGRPVSGFSAGMAGGLSAVDAAGASNPAALGRWRGMAGWAVGSPSYYSFEGPAASADLRATRFPLFGFASRVLPTLAVGVTISDYLDRTWSVTRRDSMSIRGEVVRFDDLSRSVGGVSDLRLGGAYHASDRVLVGLGLHTLSGSTRLSIVRDFTSTSYDDFVDVSITDFTGFGLSAGSVVTVGATTEVGLALRAGGTMTATSTGGASATVALPTEVTVGTSFAPASSIALGITLQYASWERAADDLAAAGQPRSRNTAALSAGAQFGPVNLGLFRSPLRVGYRWRQLPFPVGSDHLSENALSGGFSLNFAQDRTTFDIGFERGSREAGPHRERFTTFYVGATVRP